MFSTFLSDDKGTASCTLNRLEVIHAMDRLKLSRPSTGEGCAVHLCSMVPTMNMYICVKEKFLKILDARWLFRAELLIPVLWIPAKENIQVSVVSQIFPWNVIFLWPQVHWFDTFCQASWSVIQKVCFDCTCGVCAHMCYMLHMQEDCVTVYAWGGQRFTSDVLLCLSLFCFWR